MLKIRTSDSAPIEIIFELTQPTVYLDYCVIASLARDSRRGEQFRGYLLEKCGTLYLSWAHLVELFGLGTGPTYNSIRNYLASFGRSFILIDSDANEVIRRESVWTPNKQNPVIDEDFCRLLIRSWTGQTELNVGLLLDVGEDPAFFAKHQASHRQHKATLKQSCDAARERYRTDIVARRTLVSAQYVYTPGQFMTDYLYRQLARLCVTTNDEFNETDGLDFEHCVVSMAYCDFVVLDKKWARRCKEIDLPPAAAKVFSTVEIDTFLDAIKSWRK